NDMPTSPDSVPQAIPAAAAPSDTVIDAKPVKKKGQGGRQGFLIVVVIVLAALLAAYAWYAQRELSEVRAEVARRMQSGDNVSNETRIIAKSVQETVTELQAKVNVLENKQVEAQSQQLALEQLYQDLFKRRDDWALAEVEQVLSTASQQLQLAGNVQGALIALQNADAKLSRAETPQFVNIRRAIG